MEAVPLLTGGTQYSSAIFYHNDEQKRLAELSKEKLEKAGIYEKPIITEILKFDIFYKAEDYHQDYYKKNSLRYKYYRGRSGRDQFLKEIWKGREKDEETHTASVQSHTKKWYRASLSE